jgi:hypothetical protein
MTEDAPRSGGNHLRGRPGNASPNDADVDFRLPSGTLKKLWRTRWTTRP